MNLSFRVTNYVFDRMVNLWGLFLALISPFVSLAPLVFRIRMTNKCNLNCHYCYVGESLNKKNDKVLSLEEWRKIITNIPKTTLVDITGGEPLLTPQFEDILKMMLDKKLKISLITNGTIFKESLFRMFVDKNLSHLMISFDGNEVLHDKVRGKGNFTRSIGAALKLIDYKKEKKSRFPLLVAKITYTENNHSDVESLIHYLIKEVGFDGVTLNLLFENSARDGFSNGKSLDEEKFQTGNTIVFSPEKISSMTTAISGILDNYRGIVQVRPEIHPSQLKEYFTNPLKFSPKGCYKYRSVVTMYSDGVMTPCDLGLDVGDIRQLDYNLAKIHQQALSKKFFKSFEQLGRVLPGCQGCCLKKHESVG